MALNLVDSDDVEVNQDGNDIELKLTKEFIYFTEVEEWEEEE